MSPVDKFHLARKTPAMTLTDISRTFHCGPGKPTGRQKQLYSPAYEQVHHNLELIGPGVSFRELSERSWRGPAEFEEALLN